MIGVAGFGAVFAAQVSAALDGARGADGAALTVRSLDTPDALDALPDTTSAVLRQAVAEGSSTVFRVASLAAAAGIVIAARLRIRSPTPASVPVSDGAVA